MRGGKTYCCGIVVEVLGRFLNSRGGWAGPSAVTPSSLETERASGESGHSHPPRKKTLLPACTARFVVRFHATLFPGVCPVLVFQEFQQAMNE